MSDKANIFDAYVIKGILANNRFGITQVLDIESVKSTFFNKESYSIIEGLIKKGEIEAIKGFLIPEQNEASEYLDVMIFKDQSGKPYVVTVYDSNELWQYPQVIDIFPL